MEELGAAVQGNTWGNTLTSLSDSSCWKSNYPQGPLLIYHLVPVAPLLNTISPILVFTVSVSFFIYFNIYLFILFTWLHWVLVVALEISMCHMGFFINTHGFCSCGMQASVVAVCGLSCSLAHGI